ncbi:unnamed protein product [Sphenostylis stenocarpa]|uniref:Uncharacterized protein n=1 Tax=Sphenostylis stenocarpa TaxID=92480 RepID=A0AA86SKB4_9FABA|nr:unnamed protein product [Sphenostylis stenocarpa]
MEGESSDLVSEQQIFGEKLTNMVRGVETQEKCDGSEQCIYKVPQKFSTVTAGTNQFHKQAFELVPHGVDCSIDDFFHLKGLVLG